MAVKLRVGAIQHIVSILRSIDRFSHQKPLQCLGFHSDDFNGLIAQEGSEGLKEIGFTA